MEATVTHSPTRRQEESDKKNIPFWKASAVSTSLPPVVLQENNRLQSFRQHGEEENIFSWKVAIARFSAIVERRLSYFDSLRVLEDDWISGGGTKPSESVVDIAKQILCSLRDNIAADDKYHVPKLILGPIPSGGIGISIILDAWNMLRISLFNDNEHEIESEIHGKYSEEDASYENSNVVSEVNKSYKNLCTMYDLQSKSWANSRR